MTDGNEPINPAVIQYEDGKPMNNYQCGNTQEQSNGLTKLEYFAAKAMQAIISNPADDVVYHYDDVALHSVQYAKALITELNKTE